MTVVQTQIVAPIVISGEALGINSQKALIDRAVLLKVKSPTGRKSLHDPKKTQWDDVLALREQYPHGLSAVAGWIVQEALTVQDEVLAAVVEGRKDRSGRVADKIGILRAGARLMDYLLSESDDVSDAWKGTGATAAGVEQWITEYEGAGLVTGENTLTLQILPWALRTYQYPDRPLAAHDQFSIDSPAFIKNLGRTPELGDDEASALEIWFSPVLLAQAYEREYRGRVERRTQTESALRDQSDALGAPSKRFKIINGAQRSAYYRKITGSLAERIISRARGE